MDLFKAADFYLERIGNPQVRTLVSVVEQTQVRVLLVDQDTMASVSMVTTHTELLAKNILMVDALENEGREEMRELGCVCYVRPTETTIGRLVAELREPRYGRYQIFFSNTVTKGQLERLAESDVYEVVTKVEEVFQDFYTVAEDVFSVGVSGRELFAEAGRWERGALERVQRSVQAVLLALKLNPVVYYERGSEVCAGLARAVERELERNKSALFDFPEVDAPPVLVVVERGGDVMTPLLQPWTYQAMLHEYLGIRGNVVDCSHVEGLEEEMRELVVSAKHDPFFKETRYLNFGELGDRIKRYVEQYKSKTRSTSQINTIEDIRRFIERFPEFKKLSTNVSKHMAILGELDSQLQRREIWQLSELEQNLAVHDDNSADLRELLQLLQHPQLSSFYKLKLACIHALRHQGQLQKGDQVSELLRVACSPQEVAVYHKFRQVHGSSTVSKNSPHDNDLISGLSKKFNKFGQSNADNVYMQHTPVLSRVLEGLAKGRLNDERFRCTKDNIGKNTPVQDVVIFMVGGATFEEARIVHQFNETVAQQGGAVRVVLGSNDFLRTEDFLRDFEHLYCTSGKETELSDLL